MHAPKFHARPRDMMSLTALFLIFGHILLPAAVSGATIFGVISNTTLSPTTTLLTNALQLADLQSKLDNATAILNITYFAPSDSALMGMLAVLGLTPDVLVTNAVKMAPILLYHAILPGVNSSQIISGGTVAYDSAFAPWTITSSVDLVVGPKSGGGVSVSSVGSDANVTTANLLAGDSVVHVIDSVLLPFYPSAAELMARNPDASTMYKLLNSMAPGTLALLSPLAALTVLLPRNAAFTTALSNNSATLKQLVTSATGVQYLTNYHVIPKPVNLSVATSVTTLGGLSLTLTTVGTVTTVKFQNGTATIVGDPYLVGMYPNGTHRAVVYFIDQVMVPPTFNTIAEALAAQVQATSIIGYLSSSSVYAGLLNNATFRGTILVPTDAAFSTFVTSNAFAVAILLATSQGLKPVLDIHVIPNVAVSLSTVANGTTSLTTNGGTNTLKVSKTSGGAVTFVSTVNNSTATALGYEYYLGNPANASASVIFIDAVLLPASLQPGSATSLGGPSPAAMLLFSALATALLHLFGHQ